MIRNISKIVFTVGLFAFLANVSSADAADKLLQQSDLTYLGAFRLPSAQFSYGGKPIVYSPSDNTLYIGAANDEQAGREGLYKVSIPTIVNSSTLTNLNTASVLAGPANVFNGTLNSIEPTNGGLFSGALLNGNKLIVSAYAYYDGGYTATKSHATINADLSGGFSGFVTVNGNSPAPTNVGYTGGYMTPIPSDYQSALGGTALTGQSNITIMTRTSYGPVAYSFSPTLNTNLPSSTAANALLYYDDNANVGGTSCATHWTLGAFSSQDGCSTGSHPAGDYSILSGSDLIDGVVFPDGSKSILFFGRHGDTYCYGTGGASGGDCYDPDITDHGVHGYPYHYRVWAYNADDLAAVKAGTKNPWDVTPYAYWEPTFPYPVGGGWKHEINGASYDSANKRLFVVQDHGDGSTPLIQVFQVNVSTVADATAPAVSVTSPASNATVSGTVSVTANASDSVGVSKVEFYLNGTLQATDTATPYLYSWDTSTFAAGTYTLMAKAYDAAGNVGQSGTITVTVVKDTTAPAVSLTSPGNNAAASGTVTIAASASDNVGVSKVEFYENGVLLAASNVTPYSCNWNTASVSNGSYTLTAKAYDAAGNVGQTGNVAVTVNNPTSDTTAPTVSAFTLPATAASTAVNVSSFTATDNVAVTGYCISETNSSAGCSWTNSAPTAFTFSGQGLKTAYAFARDAAGNVSTSRSSQTTITLTSALTSGPGWVLTFQDEFDGTSLDTAKWGRRTHNNSTRNDPTYEQQTYIDGAFTASNGELHIEALKSGSSWTSGIINSCRAAAGSCSGFSQSYGYFEMRAKFPAGNGFWPAFWLLPTPLNNHEEIDVLELTTINPNTNYKVWQTWHDVNGAQYQYEYDTAANWGSSFHTFAIDWEPGYLKWYVDGVLTYQTTSNVPNGSNPYFIMANLAIGTSTNSGWPGSPTASTPSPAYMDIDYIRVYQKSANGGYATIPGPTPIPTIGGSSTPDTAAPTAPTNFTAQIISGSEIDLAWSASTDNVSVAGYRIYRGGALVTTVSGTTYQDTGLAANTSYSYYIKAIDGTGNASGNSSTVNATTNNVSTAVLGYNVIGTTTDQNNNNHLTCASFTMPSQGGTATSMSVYIATPIDASSNNQWSAAIYSDASGSPGSLVASTSSAAATGNAWNSASISANLAANTVYWECYNTNSANNTSNQTKLSSGAVAQHMWRTQTFGTWPTTFGTPAGSSADKISSYVSYNISSTGTDTTPPTIPANPSATAVSSSQINLSWTASTDNVAVTGYRVFRNGAQVGTSTANSYQDTGLSANTSYIYTVAAYDAANNVSAQSSSVSATTQQIVQTDTTPPTIPANPSATAVSSSQIKLSWTASTDNVAVTAYRIFRNGTQVGISISNSYQDTGLSANTSYSYYINAFDAAVNTSGNSSTINGTTNNASTGVLGYNVVGTKTDQYNNNHLSCSSFAMPSQGGTAKSMSVYITTPIDASTNNNQWSGAIYSDASGSPGSLLASTASGTATGNAWNSASISANLAANTVYWECYNTNSINITSNQTKLSPGTAAQHKWRAQTFGTWPTAFGTPAGSSAEKISSYVSY